MGIEAGDPARIGALRARLGLSQEHLAKRLGVSYVTVSRWETGRTGISAAGLRRIAALEDAQSALPAVPSSFVGRDAEIEAVCALLTGCRMVTLVGAGGAGKSRLALEVARRAIEPGLPAHFVALEPVTDPALTAARVAIALGLRDRADVSPVDAVVQELAANPALLVLDGAEHVVADDGIGRLAARILAASARTRILVTSRRLTGAPGENVWPVPGMATADAVRLFATRARESVHGFELTESSEPLVAELCGRVDGLPLGIELAAAWVGTLSVRQILDRKSELLGLAGGSNPLLLVAESSYALLGSAAQLLLEQLSVFAGVFSLDDAQAVAGPDLVFGMRALVDSSWLNAWPDGSQQVYRMLATLREYAAARLAARGDGSAAEQVRERHARHFADEVARPSEDMLASKDRAVWISRMERASPDLDAALAWADASGDAVLGLTMSTALWRWWLTTGRFSEGRRWLARFLADPARLDPVAVAEARRAMAVLAVENGDYAEAIDQAGQALDTFLELGGPVSAARAATVLGSAHRYLGDDKAAAGQFEDAVGHWRRAGDEAGIVTALNNVALATMDTGDLARARQLLEEVLDIKRRLGSPRSIALGLVNLAHVMVRAGDPEPAGQALTEASTLAAGLGDRHLDGKIAGTAGDLARSLRDFPSAVESYDRALVHFRAVGAPHDVVVALHGLGLCKEHLGQHAEAVRLLREGENIAMTARDAAGLADVRGALADLGQRPRSPLPGGLTVRQAEILGYVSAGMTNKDIAGLLHLSTGTVERHLATCYRKLGLHNRSEATRYALRNGLYRNT
jgi:predicted ATPase/DNA-binding CsgD family transcriptional regulator